MKPLTLLLMALFLGPSVGASPSSEEFVIEAIQDNEEITGIQEAAPVRPMPASQLIEVVQGAASQLQMMQAGEVSVKLEILAKGD